MRKQTSATLEWIIEERIRSENPCAGDGLTRCGAGCPIPTGVYFPREEMLKRIYSTRYAGSAAGSPKVGFFFGKGSSFESTCDLYSEKYGTPKQPPTPGLDQVFLAPGNELGWRG